MVGLAGPGAHALGADVEQMRRLGRRISDAAAHPAAAVDQRPSRCRAARAAPQGSSRKRRRRQSRPGRRRSDFIVGPALRVRRAGLARLVIWSYMSVTVLPAVSVNQPGTAAWTIAREPRADQLARRSRPRRRHARPSSSRASADARGTAGRPMPRCAVGSGCVAMLPRSSNRLATPTGFEPVALRLGIWCSILLSYGVAWHANRDRRAAAIN